MSRFSLPPDPVFVTLNASIGFDWRLYPYDVEQSRAHATMLAAAGIITDTDRDELLERARPRPGRARRQRVPVPRLRRGHPHGRRAAADRDRRRRRRQAPHGALAQRPGRDRHGDVHPRARAAGDRGAAGPADRDRAGRRGAPGLADARLHAPAARAAGVPLAPPAGLLLDVPARRRALRGGAGRDDASCRWARAPWPA